MRGLGRLGVVLVGTASVMAGVCGGTSEQAYAHAQAEPDEGFAAGSAWLDEDWRIFESKVRFADEAGLADLSMGETAARIGETFVGTEYIPATLEQPGPESLVINFRALDCVTFVENVLAIARFARKHGAEALSDRAAAEAAYERYLTELRYRGGVLDGYPSRLHYFSEWLTDNESAGLVRVVTSELEPARDAEPVNFMSRHPDAYRQLADPEVLAAIEEMETRLNAGGPRLYVPEDRLADVADGIMNGDVIAVRSTLAGLDIAHTGLAFWKDGNLHLLHAPLVGDSVEVSERPLAERIVGLGSQDGVMVARPLDR